MQQVAAFVWRSEENLQKSGFYPSIVWIPGMRLTSSDLPLSVEPSFQPFGSTLKDL